MCIIYESKHISFTFVIEISTPKSGIQLFSKNCKLLEVAWDIFFNISIGCDLGVSFGLKVL